MHCSESRPVLKCWNWKSKETQRPWTWSAASSWLKTTCIVCSTKCEATPRRSISIARIATWASIWREAWEILLPQWEGRIAELAENTATAQLTLCGDHFRFVQLFRILFENALAACGDPVRIEITCSPTVLAGGKAIRISVRDNGPGLNQEQRERIFEPFYTTKTKGTGLGMAIAQRIVEAHEGKIQVGTCAGHGAEILVTLPCLPPR